MPVVAPLRLVCLWLCADAVAGHLHGPIPETTTLGPLHPTADGSAQSHTWSTLRVEDTRGSGSPQPPCMDTVPGVSSELHRRAVRKSDAQNRAARALPGPGEEALRTEGNIPSESGLPGEELKPVGHGATCLPGSCGDKQRQRRSAKPAMEALPTAMAQEQEADPPFGLNSSDYEEEQDYSLPDTTPLGPANAGTRRKPLRNPFFPVTAETYGAYAVMILAVVIFTVGIIGNVSVMCIVCHNYYMRSISNSLLANLALWDFIIVFFCLPLVVFHQLTKNWLLGEFSCRIIPYLEVASLGVTTFTLCALCIDRFRAATNVQMYYEMIENWASTAAKLAVIWVGALLLALPELLLRQLVTEAGDPPHVAPCERCVVRVSTELPDTLYVLGLTYDGARLWWYFGCYFCLPTLFTIGSSLLTARRIRRAERACVRGEAGKKQIQLESQMNCAVVALAILYGFCIIPENICNIVSAYMATGVPRRALDVLQLISQLLLFCKSAVTPVLLFFLCRPFTKAFLDCCCCCCEECGTSRGDEANDELNANELELEPFDTVRSVASTSTAVGTHC